MAIDALVFCYLPPLREVSIAAPLWLSLLTGAIILTEAPAIALQAASTQNETAQRTSISPASQVLLLSQVNVLQLGSFGAEVSNLQIQLRDLGFYNGEIDGDFGSSTEAAVTQFQQNNGLVADGIVGAETATLLRQLAEQPAVAPSTQTFGTPTPDDGLLNVGDTGADVIDLQTRLRALRLYNGAIDGDFGSSTEAAVREFQRSQGLVDDGIVGQQTLGALRSRTSGSNSGVTPAPVAVGNTTTSSENIRELQQRLQRRGFYQGAIDGVAGEQTRAAIQAAQRAYNLSENDIIEGRF